MQKAIAEDQPVAHILLCTMNSVLAADMEPDRLDHKGNIAKARLHFPSCFFKSEVTADLNNKKK
jgi:hypothetical protein